MGNKTNKKEKTLRSQLRDTLIGLVGITLPVMTLGIPNEGTPAVPINTEYHNIEISNSNIHLTALGNIMRSNRPTQEQLDTYMPILREEMDRLPQELLEECIDGIRLTGNKVYHFTSLPPFFSNYSGVYFDNINEIYIALPKGDSFQEQEEFKKIFWHELHHGCDYNLSTPQEHAAYEALRERRPKGDITGYSYEYGKKNRKEDEATLLELLAVNYDEYINRIAEDPVLKAKGMELERRYNNWTDGEMDMNYWKSIAIDRFSQLK